MTVHLLEILKKEVIGVEPCKNLAIITKKRHKTYSEYWDIKLAKKITSHQKIDLIYSANTLSHTKNISEIFRAINLSLSDKGVLVLEDPSLLECMKILHMINSIVNIFISSQLYHLKRFLIQWV